MAISFSQTSQQFEEVKKAAVDALKKVFPVRGKRRSIVMESAWAEDNLDTTDYKSQAAAKQDEATWGVPVYAHLKLVEADGKVIDENKRIRLFNLPKPTQRHSYIVKGNEYQVHNQLRLKPGVYTIRKQNGELKTQLNLARGKNFDLVFDEDKAVFFISKVAGGQANIPLYPILLHLGVSKADVVKSWGERIVAANDAVKDTKAVEKLEFALGLKKDMDLKSYLRTTEISPETTKAALGKAFTQVDGLLLLASSKNLLDVHRGKEEATDRDSLEYKELHGIDDFIKERLEKNSQSLSFRLLRNVDNVKRTRLNQIVSQSPFTSVIESFFTQDDKSATPEQTNPLEMLSGTTAVTFMGAGGIGSEHAITTDMRQIHPSHLGLIDAVHTPESSRIGVNLHTPLGAVKDGKDLKMTVIDSAGNKTFLSPIEAKGKRIGFPGQKGATVQAMYKGQIVEVPRGQVDYWIPDPTSMFSWSTNLIPFLPSAQGNRAMMAAKMQEQAISLKNREAPLVQTAAPGGKTFAQVVGEQTAVLSPVDGTITEITDDHMTISGTKVNLYNNFSLNRKSFLHHTPTVKVGDKVKKGQLIADSNYTKDGVLALGTNMKAAYIAYKGLNFDDGIVVSETAAQRLTSEHIYQKELPIFENTLTGLDAYRGFYPTTLTPDNLAKMDKDGVIKKGSLVKYGESVITGLQKRTITGDISKISKVLSERPKDISVHWTLEDTGRVIDVIKKSDKIVVVIKTEEAAKIGDKLAGLHGNKGVIAKIIPDSEMPRTKEGPVEILLNPMGIVSRINVSQTYESAAAKAANKLGKPIVVSNFDGSNNLKQIKSLIEKTGVNDKEELFDKSGKSLGEVHVGLPHILKLFKQSQGNYSVRQGGPGHGYDANMQPLKAGGEEGAKTLDPLTMYSMLSHGARANIREMASIKSSRNDEFWKALKAGELLPPPQPSFAFDKFTTYLKGAGIDVRKDGSKIALAPLTDKHVAEMSNFHIKEPFFYRAKDFEPIKGGFFDKTKLGGFKGTKWGHLELAEPVVNPVFENAVRKLTGLGTKFNSIVSGESFIDEKGNINKEGRGLTGGAAIQSLLKKIDVDKDMAALQEKAKKAKGNALDDINKKLRYLNALKTVGLKPHEAYTKQLVPVIPSQFRPVYPLPNGNMATSDINMIYKNLAVINKVMKAPVMDLLADEHKSEIRKDLYEHVKGVSGLTDINIQGKPREGFISAIKGGEEGQPKEGFFISKLLSKRQDFVGRGTVLPDPDLGIDEVGIPEAMAWKLFEPFVVRELKTFGKTPLQAMEEIKHKSPLAKRALEIIMAKRHVMLNRAPSLHKFSIMAFKPKVTDGKSIKIPPLVNKGFNADHDGDQQMTSVLTFVPEPSISLLTEEQANSRLEDTEMTARFREIVGIKDASGDFFIFNLADFPHTDLLGSKNNIDFYKAPEGVKVLSYDQDSKAIEWKEVYGWSKHYQKEVEIVTLRSGRQIVTDDDPRAVYGIAAGGLTPERFRPEDAKERHVLVPLLVRGDSCLKGKKQFFDYRNKRYELTEKLGHFIGSVVANGWVETRYEYVSGNVFVACVTDELGEAFLKEGKDLFSFTGKALKYERGADCTNTHGASKKWGFMSNDAAFMLSSLVGHGARNKHLPQFFLSANEEFRNGLFAGLMDHDGSITIVNAKGKKPQFVANYPTTSIRLAQELQWLAKSLGIRSRISTLKTPAGEPIWLVSFSNFDIKDWGGKGMLHPKKLAAFKVEEATCSEFSPSAAKNDPVPIHRETASTLRGNLGSSRGASKEDKTTYMQLSKAIKCGHISRVTSIKILETFHPNLLKGVPYLEEWKRIVENTDVSWDPVESFERTGIKEDGFDLTVPGYETFMNVEGVVLSNTMTIHIPITEEANTEAAKMLPSRNLFQPGTGKLMIAPSQEAQIGIYYLSKTQEGLKKLNAITGPKFPVTKVLDKKGASELLTQIANEASAVEFSEIVKKLKSAGEDHAYNTGFSIGVHDLHDFSRERAPIVEKARELMAKSQDPMATNKEITKLVDGVISNKLKDKGNPFFDQIESGAKGDPSQLRSIMFSPMFVADAKNRVVKTPISKSYSEGLTASDYWISMYGARKGMMDRAISTSLPGAFSKDVMNTTIDNVISMADCGTKNGIILPLESRDTLERFTAGDQNGVAHNTLVDHNTISMLKKGGAQSIKVRSPLKCLAPKGTCAHCYGLDEHKHVPEIGENVGAKAGQTISEPLVQIAMNCSVGNIVDSEGRCMSFEDFYDAQDTEEILDGDCATKKIDYLLKDCGEDVLASSVQKHPAHDEMLFIKTKKGHTLLVQANHPLWIYENGVPREVEASLVEKKDVLKVDLSHLRGSSEPPFDPYFIGRYLADGCTRIGNGTERYDGVPVATIVTGADIEIKEKTLKSSRELAKLSKKDVQIYSPAFASTFSKIVRGNRAWKKRLMPGFNRWSKKSLEELLAGYIDGDGTVYLKNGTTCVNIYTSSFVLLQQIQMICFKIGVSFCPMVVPREKLQHRPHFIAILRFEDEGVRQHSIKMQRIEFSPQKTCKFEATEFDYVTYIKPLWSWEEPVYDVKTTSLGFTCGTIRNHNSFHTGGAAGTGAQAGGFTRINQLLSLPKVIAGAATLSPVDGKITKIVKGIAGGYDVFVNDHKTHITQGNKPIVSVGDHVSKGDALSDGPIRPQDLANLKGVTHAQDYITNQLQDTYKQQGVGVSRKTFETVVRSLTNTTQVQKPPVGSSWLPGDIIPLNVANHYNENLIESVETHSAIGLHLAEDIGGLRFGHVLTEGEAKALEGNGIHRVKIRKEELVHKPFVKGLQTLPLLKQDWMAALGYRNLAKALTEGASQGWQTDIEGYHPLPALAHGTTFGKGKDGKY